MLIYNKIRDVKNPTRAHYTDAGIDLFIPNDFEETTLKVGDSVLIPSGIRIKLPENTAGIFFNRSSVAKKGIIIGADVVDEGYNGEIHIHLIKVSGEPVTIKAGDKIAQLVIMPVLYEMLTEYSSKCYEDATSDSERQNKGFGSTGDK